MNVIDARHERNESAWPAILGYTPYVVLWTFVPLYLLLQPTILEHHLIPFALYIGLLNAYTVGQIIVAHITKAEFPYQNILMLPLAFGVADSLGPFLQERSGISWAGWPSSLGSGVYQVNFMFMSLGIAIGVYGSFVIDVIFAICDYLDIWCLTIKHPWTEETDKKDHTEGNHREKYVKGKDNGTTGEGVRSMRLRSGNKKAQ